MTDIKGDAVAERAESLHDDGYEATALAHDVTLQDDWDRVRDRALEQHRRIDIVINNAGMALPGGIGEATLEDWNRHMAVNLTSVFLGCQMAVRQMRAQGGGGINHRRSSTAGLSAFANLAADCASKGGVRLLTKAAALRRCGRRHPDQFGAPRSPRH